MRHPHSVDTSNNQPHTSCRSKSDRDLKSHISHLTSHISRIKGEVHTIAHSHSLTHSHIHNTQYTHTHPFSFLILLHYNTIIMMRPPSHGARRTVFQALTKPSSLSGSKKQAQMKRSHHPDPFNPKTTKGWANALKVRQVVSFS